MVRYCLEFGGIILILLPVYLKLRKPWKRELKREIALAAFVLFMAGLLVLALRGEYHAPANMWRAACRRIATGEGINFVPFRSIQNYFRYYGPDGFLVNFMGNIVMFMPWGFGLPLLWKRCQRVWVVAAHSMALTLFIETVQLFVGRSVDVDDLILNFAGSCLGACVYFLLRRKVFILQELAG